MVNCPGGTHPTGIFLFYFKSPKFDNVAVKSVADPGRERGRGGVGGGAKHGTGQVSSQQNFLKQILTKL